MGRLYDHGGHPRPLIDRVRDRLGGGVLRGVIVDASLVLVSEKQIALMSIRHQREVDFDFGD